MDFFLALFNLEFLKTMLVFLIFQNSLFFNFNFLLIDLEKFRIIEKEENEI